MCVYNEYLFVTLARTSLQSVDIISHLLQTSLIEKRCLSILSNIDRLTLKRWLTNCTCFWSVGLAEL